MAGIEAIKIRDEAHWHELRRQHLGGSEVAALFGQHQGLSRYHLYCIKSGRVSPPDLSGNERILWGTLLEPAVARAVADRTGMAVRKSHRYLSMPEIKLGGTIDYHITCPRRGLGVLEIKTVDAWIFRQWDNGEPPLAYQLQLQTYLALTNRAWGMVAVLIGGNRLELFEYDRRPATIEMICDETAQLWLDIRDNSPPEPNWVEDAEVVGKLYRHAEAGKAVDLSDQPRVLELCAAYQAEAEAERKADKAKKAARAELLTMIGDADLALCGSYKITAGEVEPSPDKMVTAEDIGTVVKGRSGFRSLRVYNRNRERPTA